MLVFSVARPFFSKSRCEFTYDIADTKTVPLAWTRVGCRLQPVMAALEARLRDAGELELAHRYNPVWHEDFLVRVKKRNREFIRLIAREAKLIDAVINVGTLRTRRAELQFERVASHVLRKFNSVDMRELIPKILEETARILSEDPACRGDYLVNTRTNQSSDALPPRRPNRRIRLEKDGHYRRTYRSRKMAYPGIIADINARGRKPAAKRV